MKTKNYNIKITKEDEEIIKSLRDDFCLNISQYIRKCLRDVHKEMKSNGKKGKKGL